MGPSRVRVGSPRGWVGAPCVGCGARCLCWQGRASIVAWSQRCGVWRCAMRHGLPRNVTRNATDRARSFPPGLALPGRSRLGWPRPRRGFRNRQGHGLGSLGRRRAKLAVPCEAATPPRGQLAAGVALEGLPQPPCSHAQTPGDVATRDSAQRGEPSACYGHAVSVAMGHGKGDYPEHFPVRHPQLLSNVVMT